MRTEKVKTIPEIILSGQDKMGKTMIDLVIGLFVNSGFFIGKVFFFFFYIFMAYTPLDNL